MVLTIEQLEKILASGGGLRVSASSYSVSQLTRLASAAASGHAALQLIETAALTAAQLTLLAEAAPGHIVFDLVKPAADPAASSGL